MNTDRFETFYDAVLAIVITVLVLKIPQPLSPDWGAFISNSLSITTYLIVFLAIINIWYSNQNLFQYIDDINNKSIIAYGVSIFLFSLFPYFASWISLNVYSLAAETIFGLIILFANISHILAVVVVFGANKSNEKLNELNIKKINFITPIIIIIIGFHLEQIDNAAEVVFLPDRKLENDGILSQPGTDLLHRAIEVGAHDIHLVDECHTGNIIGVSLAPDIFRLRLNAAFRTEHADRSVQYTQGTLHLNGKVYMARGVYDIDPVL